MRGNLTGRKFRDSNIAEFWVIAKTRKMVEAKKRGIENPKKNDHLGLFSKNFWSDQKSTVDFFEELFFTDFLKQKKNSQLKNLARYSRSKTQKKTTRPSIHPINTNPRYALCSGGLPGRVTSCMGIQGARPQNSAIFESRNFRPVRFPLITSPAVGGGNLTGRKFRDSNIAPFWVIAKTRKMVEAKKRHNFFRKKTIIWDFFPKNFARTKNRQCTFLKNIFSRIF